MSNAYIGSLDVSCRFKTTCKNAGVETLKQLAELSRSYVLRWNNCGKTTVNEMVVVLEQHGLAFKGEKFWGGRAIPNRKIIQIAVDGESMVYALCNDGTVWYYAHPNWTLEAPAIPQGNQPDPRSAV